MHVQAVIFDFDGIIVDSEPLHHRAFCRVLDKHQLPLSWDCYYEHYLGFDDRDVLRTRFKEKGIALEEETLRRLMDEKARAFVEIIRQEGVTAYPGVVSLVRSLSAQIPVAICSGALMSDINPILDILGLQEPFAIRVTADQVHVSKPDPESYREVYRRLQEAWPDRVTAPSRCVAIEDTPAGISAARGAGLNVLAVKNTYDSDALANATASVDSLVSVDLSFLDHLVKGAK